MPLIAKKETRRTRPGLFYATCPTNGASDSQPLRGMEAGLLSPSHYGLNVDPLAGCRRINSVT